MQDVCVYDRNIFPRHMIFLWTRWKTLCSICPYGIAVELQYKCSTFSVENPSRISVELQ
jgi:hypothetical protein